MRKQWDRLLAERTFEKSLRVEERYPYFSLPVKPKIPFGMTKMTELLMRVGINQEAKPMRVLFLSLMWKWYTFCLAHFAPY